MHDPEPLVPPSPPAPDSLLDLWQTCAEILRQDLGDANFDLWFSNFSIASLDKGEVILEAPGTMYAIWVEENFKQSLLSIFEKLVPNFRSVRFSVSAEALQEAEKAALAPSGSASKTCLQPKVLSEKVSFEKLIERGRAAGLVDTLTFENFVPGDNSQLAWAAAQAVANEPGKTYQPLFFHSACGLGKTHLLHGIGWASLRLRPKSKIIFATAEQFANDYIDAIQRNALAAFRKRYREADLLLLDDVQFLGRKEGLQREFFHTFNQLVDRRCQIVLASDCPASEINELEDRLSSRFQWGLSVEIHRPGLETRAAILRRKRDDWKMGVSDELINEIVEHVRGNVRVLEGALIRVAMVGTMNDTPVSIADVREILSDLCTNGGSQCLDLDEIKQAVSEHYGIEIAVINGKVRTARIAEARQVAMFLIRTMTDLSLVDIAASFGKDHGTVIHAVKKIRAKCETSPALKSTVELIKRRLVRGGGSGNEGARRQAHALRGATNPKGAKNAKGSAGKPWSPLPVGRGLAPGRTDASGLRGETEGEGH